jgi:hypothetical protein
VEISIGVEKGLAMVVVVAADVDVGIIMVKVVETKTNFWDHESMQNSTEGKTK